MKILVTLAALASLTAVPYRPHEEIALRYINKKQGRVKAFPSPSIYSRLASQGGR